MNIISQQNYEKSFEQIEFKLNEIHALNEKMALKIQHFLESESDLRNEIQGLKESNRHLIKSNEILKAIIDELVRNQKATDIKIGMHEFILQAIKHKSLKSQDSISEINQKEQHESTITDEVETISNPPIEKNIQLEEEEV